MAKIIVVAQNYAFGPIGKLLTITPHLKKAGHELFFIGEGTAYQLGSKEDFDGIVRFDTDSPDFEKVMSEKFKNSDVLLSCMDMASIRLAQKVGLPTIWLDTLFWWRHEIPDYILEVDCYIKQNTVNDDRNIKLYGPRIKKLMSVGPLVEMSVLKSRKKKNQILVAFGGMEAKGWYKVGKDTNYPFLMTKLLEKVDLSAYKRVLVTGNERVIKLLASKYKKNKQFVFKTLPHAKFAQELADSELTIMAPGLETPLEAFSYNIPAIFLTPSNASNYMQLNSFIDDDVARMRIHLADYYQPIAMMDIGFRDRLALYLGQQRTLEKDTKAQKDIVDKLNGFVKDKKLQAQQVKQQQEYIKRLHGNGVNECVHIVEDFIKHLQ